MLGPLWVWLALSERPDAATLAGGAVVIAAIVIQASGPAGARAERDAAAAVAPRPGGLTIGRTGHAQPSRPCSHAWTASPRAPRSLRRLWFPRTSTMPRPGPPAGIPNGSLAPCTTSTGTCTASSSGWRVDSGRPGGCSGNARQSTPIAPVAAAVRHATRAPDERPPAISGSPRSSPASSCSTTAVQAASSWCAGAGERRPATR